jgi:phage terminase small subunit
MKLSPKQARFVEEYLIDLNASAAARRAGYSPRTAGQTGFDLLKKPEIQAAIQDAKQRRAARTEITADKVLREYGRLAFSDLRRAVKWNARRVELVDSETLDPDAAAAVAEVSLTKDGAVRVKLHSKTHALEALARHLGLFDPQADADPDETARAIQAALREIEEVTGSHGC